MNIMISINREYIGYACIMLMSLKQHHKDIMLFVYILHNELKDEDFWRMDEIIGSEGIELIPVFVPEGTVKEFQIGSWPEAAAYRLLATDLFAGSLERILHLDVDILITGDISEFYNTPFEDHYLVACEDFLPDEIRRKKCREFDKDENTSFFNSGVVLFNIPKLSSDGFYYNFYAEVLSRYPNIHIEYPDQDMLNLLFNEKTKYADRIKYNYAPFFYKVNDKEHFYDSKEALESNCNIIHMIRGSKPWENMSKTAADELWWEYAKRTPFYLEMKIKHVQTMINKEQKLKSLIDDKLKQTVQGVDSMEELLKAEELLFQMLGMEFAMADALNNR